MIDIDDPAADPFEAASEAAAAIADLTGVSHHDVGLTLGSGWGRAAELLGELVAEVPATEVPGFSRPALAGHGGTLRSIRMTDGRHVLVIGARTHLYEGLGVRRVVHSVRTAAAAGARTMVLTNGAGSIDPSRPPGTPVLLSDHINLTGTTPLEGAQFIDMSEVYSERLRGVARTVGPNLTEGVYCQFRGPQYETPAEIRMARAIGGDLVGMSTALEAIAARHVGMEVLGLSLVTNLAAGIQSTPLSHDEVLEAGRQAEAVIAPLLAGIVDAS